MIRLSLTTIFVAMDEVREYETRQAFKQSPKMRDARRNLGHTYGQDEAVIHPMDTGSQAHPTAPTSPGPKTPDQRQPAVRNNLVIRSTSQPPAVPPDPEFPYFTFTNSPTQLASDTGLDIQPGAGPDGDSGNASSHNVDQFDSFGDNNEAAEKITPISRQNGSLSGYNAHQRSVSDSPQFATWLAMPPQRASPAWRVARQNRPQGAPTDESPR